MLVPIDKPVNCRQYFQAVRKTTGLKQWSGLLMDENSLPDDWTYEGVLVGMRPINDRHGIG
jgi:hypothetical protein